ncbi:GNAT family N-acetyltransferase [Gryllotalpicola protaetiae]|uniref:GNAT family N-acetyltransferase n=1 Tax=Gryllotalpicola protaetiae TaxID=2419771 RepID=A0A387BG46_9MICO|nr:GNAT family N-acetyltransferase [Gryllotalpicola protaetiae]AYG02903.1 GNAT family N-acetyltransferase [Gryllotalpicola protaetiae]
MADLRLEDLSASNIAAANALSLKPGQEQYVTPVSYSAAAVIINPATSWQRVIVDGDDVVAFIQADFDPQAPSEEFRSILWRINVDADDQGKGVGRFAVEALADEARKRGLDALYVIWEPGEDGPEAFFLRTGFEPVGETNYGDTIGKLAL